MINNSASLLKLYRKPYPKTLPSNRITQQTNSFLPQAICQFLGLSRSQNSVSAQNQSSCFCEKDHQKYCSLILSWIDTQFERSDWQFKKTYHNYTKNQRIQDEDRESLQTALQQKIETLGLNLKEAEKAALLEILSNYVSHAKYYSKYEKLISESDIYIWVCISVAYHIGFSNLCTDDYYRVLVFWGMDITMDAFEDLRLSAMQSHFHTLMRWFHYYFPKHSDMLRNKGVDVEKMLGQWLDEMLFGYMGCAFIAFFLDCFMKSKWSYLIKVIISYFESRYEKIKVKTNFMDASISTNELYDLFMNAKEAEWPLIFSNASLFHCKQE